MVNKRLLLAAAALAACWVNVPKMRASHEALGSPFLSEAVPAAGVPYVRALSVNKTAKVDHVLGQIVEDLVQQKLGPIAIWTELEDWFKSVNIVEPSSAIHMRRRVTRVGGFRQLIGSLTPHVVLLQDRSEHWVKFQGIQEFVKTFVGNDRLERMMAHFTEGVAIC